MDLDKFSQKIRDTGFVLENRIAFALKKAGWSVISNKYYEDDLEGTVREIDLLAYKTAKVKHLDVYTTLLISCKKSASNVWALLARDININDPNSDWWPLHVWTNDAPLSYEMSRPGQSMAYHNGVGLLGVRDALAIPEVEVFAFQEMSRETAKPQNDKNIFNAVTSLMKAQAYELSALPSRKRSAAVYQFNLISVIDSDLIRLRCVDDRISTEVIHSEHYIARYIINKKESFSRVRFVTAEAFEAALADYGQLHTANRQWFASTYDNFYVDIVKDPARMHVLVEDFKAVVKWDINWRLAERFRTGYNVDTWSFQWEVDTNRLVVMLPAEMEVIAFMNKDERVRTVVAGALSAIYGYDGGFVFAPDDIPF